MFRRFGYYKSTALGMDIRNRIDSSEEFALEINAVSKAFYGKPYDQLKRRQRNRVHKKMKL